jgi:hypothetical protein
MQREDRARSTLTFLSSFSTEYRGGEKGRREGNRNRGKREDRELREAEKKK